MARTLRASLALAAACLLGSAALSNQSSEMKQFLVQADLEKTGYGPDETADPETLIRQSIEIIERRIDADGDSEIEVIYLGEGRILIETPLTFSRKTMEGILGIPEELEFRILDREGPSCRSGDDEGQDERSVAEEGPSGKEPPTLSGHNLVSALPSIDIATGEPTVTLGFDEAGKRRLAELTSKYVGSCMGIVVEGKVVFAATLYEPILGGFMQLSGGLTKERAQELAIQLRSGALPTPFVIMEERMIEKEPDLLDHRRPGE